MIKPTTLKLKQCRFCEQLFFAPRRSHTVFCSIDCHKRHHAKQSRIWWRTTRNIQVKTCPICGTQFMKYRSKKYCSLICALKGYRNSCLKSELRRKKYLQLMGITAPGDNKLLHKMKLMEQKVYAQNCEKTY